jgi:hypothetical protein
MKSLVMIINTSPDIIDLDGYEFKPGEPVMVYRNRNYFITGDRYGKVSALLNMGTFLGISFNGTPNTPEDSVRTANLLNDEAMKPNDSYTTDYEWHRSTCIDMLDGFQKQLNQFDWTAPEVTVPRVDVLRRAD